VTDSTNTYEQIVDFGGQPSVWCRPFVDLILLVSWPTAASRAWLHGQPAWNVRRCNVLSLIPWYHYYPWCIVTFRHRSSNIRRCLSWLDRGTDPWYIVTLYRHRRLNIRRSPWNERRTDPWYIVTLHRHCRLNVRRTCS
jgi:hypothetical protein